MKITEIFSTLFPKVRKVQGPQPGEVKRTDSKLLKQPDQVKLADDAKLRAALQADLSKQTDPVRDELLREIQDRVEKGNYNVPSHDIAKKILGE
jgi:anti-sigma28 factor (negative regulator of flagellin synthesis)